MTAKISRAVGLVEYARLGYHGRTHGAFAVNNQFRSQWKHPKHTPDVVKVTLYRSPSLESIISLSDMEHINVKIHRGPISTLQVR